MTGRTSLTVFCSLIALLHSCRARGGRNHLRTYNVDPTFSRWPDRTNILFYLDSAYSFTEQSYIRTAIATFQTQMKGCLTFVETTASDPRFKVHVTPYLSGVLQTFCFSYPGQSNNAVNTGATEQLLIVTRGQYGCLDGSLRSIMKLFAILVGKRNEHQRGDRETYITVFDSNIIVPNSYRLYNTSEARWLFRPYDYCSITHNQPTDYSASGTLAFAIKSGPPAIPKIDQISDQDCQIISMIYNCVVADCDAFDCLAARQNALGMVSSTPAPTIAPTTTRVPPTTTAPPPTTTAIPTTTTMAPTTTTLAPTTTNPTTRTTPLPTTTTPAPTTTTVPPTTTTIPPTTTTVPPTTTTAPPTTTTVPPTTTTPVPTTTTAVPTTTTPNPCPLSTFCSASPTESGYLNGPYATFQTLLLYSGNCVSEYTFDFNSQTLVSQTSPQLITSYFPSPGGSSVPMPVTLSYFTVDPLSTQFTLHATNQALSQDLACIPDAALSTMSASCPSGATTSTVAAAYTSATSQLNTGDGFMYQYAVDASQTEVVLTNEDFTTTYQTTSGFLSGQSLIAKITAIQIMQDQINGNPTVLAVFGLGSDGITPYVGYVTGMPLLAYPTTPLTGFAWTTPQPLRQALVGCP